jgi:aminoglycoside phosphotransferase (APT) family kinase protein
MATRHPGWKALAHAVAPGARVTRLRRLAGAGMTDAYDVTLDRAPHRVVVKLYRDGDGTAPLEWSRLGVAQRVALPVPEPIVADLESDWFGRPAVVMSRLPGRPDLTPTDIDSRVGALAQALAELHETPLNGAEGAVTLPPRFESWRAPAGEHDPLTAAAFRAVTAGPPTRTSERVLTHGDFHPGNVLWKGGRISGVVDWSEARLDTRWYDVAYCRASVCIHHGPDIADRVTDAYSAIVGGTSEELAVYDLMCVLSSRHYLAESLEADREQGHVPNYQPSVAHLDEHVLRALKRLRQ